MDEEQLKNWLKENLLIETFISHGKVYVGLRFIGDTYRFDECELTEPVVK